jgi:hypothetical protein
MQLGLRLCDAMVGELLNDRGADEALLVLNAFKQINVAGAGIISYRQRNPATALEALGISGGKVEQCMVNDAHVLFDSAAAADAAEAVLRSAALTDGTKAFYVERRDAVSLFYKLDFVHRVAAGTQLELAGRAIPFDEVFELVCERTGAHVPDGDVFADGVDVRQDILNHEIFDAVLNHFGASPPTRPPAGDRVTPQSVFAAT